MKKPPPIANGRDGRGDETRRLERAPRVRVLVLIRGLRRDGEAFRRIAPDRERR